MNATERMIASNPPSREVMDYEMRYGPCPDTHTLASMRALDAALKGPGPPTPEAQRDAVRELFSLR